jgi:hypothetical protein
MTGPRRLYAPRRARVKVDRYGIPLALGGIEVEAVREEWLVEDRWWTPLPLGRRYFELVLADGRDVTVFEQLPGTSSQGASATGDPGSARIPPGVPGSGRWYRQRG